jgi:hypothetical protein
MFTEAMHSECVCRKQSHLPLQCFPHDCNAALKALYAVLPLQQLPEVPEYTGKMTVSLGPKCRVAKLQDAHM